MSDVWRERDGRLPPRGQRVLNKNGAAVLVLWRSGESRTELLATFPQRFFPSSAAGTVAWQLADPEGQLIAGDSAGFLNGARLKGIHLGIKSGMLAAEAAFASLLAGDASTPC